MKIISAETRGFTLIELMVVLVIILFLAAIIALAVIGTRESAYTLQCLGTERHINGAYQTYTSSNGGMYPPILIEAHYNNYFSDKDESFDTKDKDGDDTLCWLDLLQSYGLSDKALHCPKYQPTSGASSYAQNLYLGSYYGNRNSEFGGPYEGIGMGSENALRTEDITDTTRTPLIAEGPDIDFNYDIAYHPNVVDSYSEVEDIKTKAGLLGQDINDFGGGSDMNYPTPHNAEGSRLASDGTLIYYHGKANILFADGHAQSVSWDKNILTSLQPENIFGWNVFTQSLPDPSSPGYQSRRNVWNSLDYYIRDCRFGYTYMYVFPSSRWGELCCEDERCDKWRSKDMAKIVVLP